MGALLFIKISTYHAILQIPHSLIQRSKIQVQTVNIESILYIPILFTGTYALSASGSFNDSAQILSSASISNSSSGSKFGLNNYQIVLE